MDDKVYFAPSLGDRHITGASRQTLMDGIRFSKELGFTIVANSRRGSPAYFFRLLRSRRSSKVFLSMYPYICPPLKRAYKLRSIARWTINLSRRLSKGPNAILYVIDLPLDQLPDSDESFAKQDPKALKTEQAVMEHFDVICVFNDYMQRALIQRYHIPKDKFVKFEVLDYGISYEPPVEKELPKVRTVVAAGSSAARELLGTWLPNLPQDDTVRWEFFGKDGDWLRDLGRKDISSKGFIPQEELAAYLGTSATFGIIDSAADARLDSYHNYGSTSKFSAYMTAGVPVFVTKRYSYICDLVTKYNVGFPFETHEQVAHATAKITHSEYSRLRANCLELGAKLRKGLFFKKAIAEAMEKLGVE